MSTTWFWSDPHFQHRKICEYAKRPFENSTQMDMELIKRHNAVVRDEDISICLGDFGFGPVGDLRDILTMLSGSKKIIIKGNHDRGVDALYDMGWDAVFNSATVPILGRQILLQHKPCYDPMPEGIEHVFHGHIHQGGHRDLVEAGERVPIPAYNLNLCVEVTEYRPVSARQALRYAQEQVRKGVRRDG